MKGVMDLSACRLVIFSLVQFPSFSSDSYYFRLLMVHLFFYDPFKTIRTKLIIVSVIKILIEIGGVLKMLFFNPYVFLLKIPEFIYDKLLSSER